MEGLAGASSVIAVVSVAVQLADGLQKLITFWKGVQDAPAEISFLFEDLEALSLVLTQVQSTAPNGSLDESTNKVLENCKTKVLQLSTKVSKANLELGSQSRTKRKWAAFKITLKKPEIESLRKFIEQAKSTLIIAKLKSIE
jgi:outer membrane lipopolysaccharide assembly protein LptE/RlpB